MFLLVVGTRPEIIKMAPIVWELRRRELPFKVLFSGQHFSENMGTSFIKELMEVDTDYNIGFTLNPFELDKAIHSAAVENNDLVVLAVGDTTTVACTALYSVDEGVPFVHLEAGLRSFDHTMREEKYRIMADGAASALFCPTPNNHLNVIGFPGKSYIVGNTITDVVAKYGKKGEVQNVALLTLHRNELLQSRQLLEHVLQSIAAQAEGVVDFISFPMHPHTQEVLSGFAWPSIYSVTGPLSFKDMMSILPRSRFVITDSGGVQEETCILGIPCCVVRPNTERQESLKLGASFLAHPEHIHDIGIFKVLSGIEKATWKHPYGENVANKICDILIKEEKEWQNKK